MNRGTCVGVGRPRLPFDGLDGGGLIRLPHQRRKGVIKASYRNEAKDGGQGEGADEQRSVVETRRISGKSFRDIHSAHRPDAGETKKQMGTQH